MNNTENGQRYNLIDAGELYETSGAYENENEQDRNEYAPRVQEYGNEIGQEIDRASDYNEKAPSKRYQSIISKKRKKRHFFLRFLIFVLIIISIIVVMNLKYFDVDSIEVKGNNEVSTEEILSKSEIAKGESIFFGKTGDVKDRILANSLIKDVDIDRKLPNKLVINVVERVPKAVLSYGAKFVVIDDELIVMALRDTRDQVPLLSGIVIKNMNAGEKIEVKNGDILQKEMELIDLAEKSDIFFKEVYVEDADAYCNIYDQLSVRGRYDDIVKSIREGKLKTILVQIYNEGIQRGSIIIDKEGNHSFSPVVD